MLLQLILNQPQALGAVLKGTPTWVWGLLAGLVWLGVSQMRSRTVGLPRILMMPVIMTGLSIWGMVSAFGNSPMFGYVMLVWMFFAALMLAGIATLSPPTGAEYDAESRTFSLPGSAVPFVLIMGIFLTRYVVNVELAMQPSLARDAQFTLIVGALYGVCSGVFAGRAVRLLRLAAPWLRTPAPAGA